MSIRDYAPEQDKEKVFLLCEKQDKQTPGTLGSHVMYLDLQQTVFTTPLVFEIDGVVVGFALTDRISDACAAYNAVIHDADVPCLSARVTYETAKAAFENGYRFMNFQGSETNDLDRWKRKFNPERSIEKTHLIYRT